MTATEKRSTAKQPGSGIQGVLFLTAGYGTRAEPLSLYRPKALLPWGETTLLGNLVNQFTFIEPEVVACNATKCPELVYQEVRRCWPGRTQMLFEEKPLGLPGTLSVNTEMFKGHWIISNTDMVLDVPVQEMVEFHLSTGSKWTVLTGSFPDYGNYGSLSINGNSRHYLGVSIVSPEVARIARKEQLSTGFFTLLRSAAERAGIFINEYFTERNWLDMGSFQLIRKHLLLEGSYIHPSARVHRDANLEGFYWIGSSCIISSKALVRNSVMLEGAVLLPGASLVNDIVPWFVKRG
ncbi:MAG: NDP-sugar synthase [Candidatus Fermentibacteraceae bacterium]|nr:NDP-sugar synthase [Candidatus Fermentibacteraceae bacterium]